MISMINISRSDDGFTAVLQRSTKTLHKLSNESFKSRATKVEQFSSVKKSGVADTTKHLNQILRVAMVTDAVFATVSRTTADKIV